MNLRDIIFSNIYKSSAFGLDISDFSIKIAQLKKKRSLELINHNRTPIPEGLIKEGEIKKEKELIEIIKKSVAGVKGDEIRTPYVISSLPEQHCFVKIIQLPKMKLKEAEEAIKWETEANIPLSLEEVYLDWQIISPPAIDHLDILINAAPKILIDKYSQVLQEAGLEPVIFEIESVATARSLIKDEFAPKPVLIIDLGFNRTSFIIFAGASIRFTSSIPLSSQKMIADLAEKFKISQEEAKLFKFRIGLDRDKEKGRVFNALLPSMTKLIDQIRDCLNFYKEHIHKLDGYQGDISKIILCGGGAYLKGLPQYLSNRIKIPVNLGNPWINVFPKNSKKIPDIPFKDSLAYSTALGLALRGTDSPH